MTKLVLSPLATLRFRSGQLVLTSPVSFRQIVLPDGILPFLTFFKTPQSEQAWIDVANRQQIDLSKLRSFLQVLQEREILMEVPDDEPAQDSHLEERQSAQTKSWDKKDLAHFDIRAHQIVQVLYGNANSLQSDFPLRTDGQPIPWFSYPAIDYLDTLDLSSASVFEFGSGGSTIYFENCCKQVVSIENNAAYLQTIKKRSSGKTVFKVRETRTSFAEAILEEDTQYDVIIIDSIPDFRQACVRGSMDRVADGGIIILDDAAMYPEAYNMLLDIDHSPIDFIGLAPLEDVVQTTSLFFNRRGNPSAIRKKFPLPQGSSGYAWNL